MSLRALDRQRSLDLGLFARVILAALSLLAITAASAPAPEKLVALIPLLVGDERSEAPTIAVVHSAISSAALFRVGIRVLSNEEQEVAAPFDLRARLRSCASDRLCIAHELTNIGADLAIIAVVNVRSEPVFIALELFDTKQSNSLARVSGPVEATDGSLERALVRRGRELFSAAGLAEHGRVVVTAESSEVSMLLDGAIRPDPGTSNTFTASPGRHLIVASRAGYTSTELAVESVAGEVKVYTLGLKPASEQTSSTLIGSPWFWISVGAVVIGGAALGFVAASNDACFCVKGVNQSCSGC